MNDKLEFTPFAPLEDATHEKLRHFRDKFFQPLSVFLTKLGVKADHLTYLSLAMGLLFAFFLNKNWLIAFFCLLLSVVLDSVDGCLARHQKTVGERGDLLDHAVDHVVLFIVVLALIYNKTIDGFWAAAYSLNYLLLIFLMMVMRKFKLHVFLVLRSKYFLYLLWALLVFTGLNFLDIFLVFFAVYMFLTNLFLFHKLRCSLSS